MWFLQKQRVRTADSVLEVVSLFRLLSLDPTLLKEGSLLTRPRSTNGRESDLELRAWNLKLREPDIFGENCSLAQAL
jgi:hypothetical protein